MLFCCTVVSDEDAVKISNDITGGVDAVMDFVGISSTSFRGYKTLNKVGESAIGRKIVLIQNSRDFFTLKLRRFSSAQWFKASN